jgi:hypothetical protein
MFFLLKSIQDGQLISKLPMKNEWIWSYVKETTSHLQNKITKNIHLGVATSTRPPFSWKSAYWIFMKLYTVVVHNLQMCMKEYRCCLKFRRGDNSTNTFTKRGVVYLWRPLDVCSWLFYFGDGMLSGTYIKELLIMLFLWKFEQIVTSNKADLINWPSWIDFRRKNKVYLSKKKIFLSTRPISAKLGRKSPIVLSILKYIWWVQTPSKRAVLN